MGPVTRHRSMWTMWTTLDHGPIPWKGCRSHRDRIDRGHGSRPSNAHEPRLRDSSQSNRWVSCSHRHVRLADYRCESSAAIGECGYPTSMAGADPDMRTDERTATSVRLLHRIFEHQAGRTPHAVALEVPPRRAETPGGPAAPVSCYPLRPLCRCGSSNAYEKRNRQTIGRLPSQISIQIASIRH